MMIRKLRLQNGWSQEQLAEFTGLSVRTIQRIERGQEASLESLKSLAAVFKVEITDLKQEPQMPSSTTQTQEEESALLYVKDIKGFYSHLLKYAVSIFILFLINYFTNPNYIWVKWVALGWGLGVLSHGLNTYEVFNFFGPAWEKKQIEKKLSRKL